MAVLILTLYPMMKRQMKMMDLAFMEVREVILQ
jgi:hypothetical protein